MLDVFLILAAAAALYSGWLLLKDPRQLLKTFMTVEELGLFEGHLPNLERAVIVAHRIEDPKDSLREAVKSNIRRGVKYVFVVSESRFEQEKELGYKLFSVLASMVLDTQDSTSINTFIDIKPLPYDWDDNPYIFSELLEEERPGLRRVIGVRGNEAKEGIAKGYIKVDPAYTRAIYNGIVPRKLQVSATSPGVEEIFSEDPKVIRLESRIHQGRTGASNE